MNSPPNFNRLAALYRWMEMVSFGPWLWRCRCAFLSEMSASRHALVLGDGDGRFTARLLAENSIVQIDAVDASPAMLRVLVHRARPHAGRVRTHTADARQLPPAILSRDPPCDLIVTHFFLDCLITGEVQSLASGLRQNVTADALWVVSEFYLPPTRFGRLIARPLVACLYLAFGWLTGLPIRTLPDHRSALNAAGFTLKERRNWLGGLLVSELWSAKAARSPSAVAE